MPPGLQLKIERQILPLPTLLLRHSDQRQKHYFLSNSMLKIFWAKIKMLTSQIRPADTIKLNPKRWN